MSRPSQEIVLPNSNSIHKILLRSGDEDEDAEPENCAAPLTCKEKDLLRYYYYIHNGIATKYVAGILFFATILQVLCVDL